MQHILSDNELNDLKHLAGSHNLLLRLMAVMGALDPSLGGDVTLLSTQCACNCQDGHIEETLEYWEKRLDINQEHTS